MTQEVEPIGFNVSTDLETRGFDLEAGQTWIYPTNYAVRDYQYNIVQEALLKNTLVSLPTGLGKTFIAAVVMYNYFRWYPQGKIIFMAPTRPLVKQQIEACYDITAIPKDVTVELTGMKLTASRETIWKEKRVFFITPQILQNDLEKLVGLHEKIKCLVFDEAHRARGNHAYCEVIRKLVLHNKYFRVLALSATPGSTISDVLEVAQNLLISHLEFRTEDSLDVRPYVFERNLTTVVVPLGEKLQQIRDDYLQILEYYTKTLVKHKVIQGNCGNLTKGKIFMTLKEFQQKTRSTGSSNYGEIMRSLNICVTLYHGFELLIRHGLRSFLSFFDEHMDKPLLKGNIHLRDIMNDVREYLGPEPVIEQLPDGSFVEIPKSTKFGHPKFYKLRDILVSHFALVNDSSRVIVFFEYRNSVKQAHALLNQARPLLKPKIFLGQGHGVTQRQQLNVIKSFKDGECNILLSTCIGEEGLDVGDVDLIICFDISNKSPIRMVQRMGRTGRKKDGHVIVLVTEGKEQQILKDCLIHKNNISLQVLSSKEITKGLCTDNPGLVPPGVKPECNKIYITIKKVPLSKKSSIKDMFRNISHKSSEPQFPPDLQIVNIKDRIPKQENLWNKENPLEKNLLVSNLFSKKIEKQRSLQPVHLVKHSPSTELLVNLLQRADSKRFNIPVTQIGYSQLTQSRNLKQGDIRNMFLKPKSSQSESLPVTQTQKLSPVHIDNAEDNVSHHSKKLLSEISNYLSVEISEHKIVCRHCPTNFDCANFCITPSVEEIKWLQSDTSLFNITLENLQMFFKSEIMKTDSSTLDTTTEDGVMSQFQKESVSDVDMESSMRTVPSCEKTMTYRAPKTLDFLLNKYSTSIVEVDEFEKQKTGYDETLLSFFKLNSTRDLFQCIKSDASQETIIYSPDIIENSSEQSVRTTDDKSNKHIEQNSISPILCTFERARSIKHFQKKLFTSQEYSTDSRKSTPSKCIERDRPNLRKLKVHSSLEVNESIDTPSKFSTNTVTSSTPLCTSGEFRDRRALQVKNLSGEKHESNKLSGDNYCSIKNKIHLEELCDLSMFGVSLIPSANTGGVTNSIYDICDLNTFGINDDTNKCAIRENEIQKDFRRNNGHKSMEVSDDHRTDTKTGSLQSKKRVGPSLLRSQTQISITQIIDLVNADENDSTISCKENFDVSNSLISTTKSYSRKKRVNPFIENEAEISVNEVVNISEDDEDHNLYEASFIDDNTQNVDTQMHIKYLQSTRSPGNRNRFKMPQKPHRFNNIYSQEVHVEDETYLDDSFVVNDKVEETCHELSELEILEEKLRRIQKKRKKKSDNTPKHVKKKRIKQILSDDSD